MNRTAHSRFALFVAASAIAAVGCSSETQPETEQQQAQPTQTSEEPIQSPTSLQQVGDGEQWGVLRAGSRDVPERIEGTIRLASYNVLNLFDEIDDPTEDGFADDFHDSREDMRGKPIEQLESVAAAIRAIDADVIGLQEIESLAALTAFRDTYLSDMGYDYIVSLDMGHVRGIEQAVVSRFPITGERVWPNMALIGEHPDDLSGRDADLAGTQMLFRRGPLRATVHVPTDGGETYDLTVFVVHHKSGRSFDYWREAETEAVLGLIEQEIQTNSNANIAVLGDFNATANQFSVEMYTAEGRMVDVAAADSLEGTAALTHASNRRIDFIMLNENLSKERVPGTAFVYATYLRPRDMDWRTTPTPPEYAADHMPMTVDLFIGDR